LFRLDEWKDIDMRTLAQAAQGRQSDRKLTDSRRRCAAAGLVHVRELLPGILERLLLRRLRRQADVGPVAQERRA
jgi:hypothetical protein